MPWMIALILVMAGICFTGFMMRAQAQEGKPAVTVETVTQASNPEIEQMLREIETRPAPEPKMGAMCYDMAMPSPVTDYVCPICGEKTLYPVAENKWSTPLNNLEELRELQAKAQKAASKREASVTLDETQFCRKCMPGFTNVPQAVLVVSTSEGCEQRTERFSAYDLMMLRDFFSGKAKVIGYTEDQQPLKEYLPRLRELLGLKE